MLGYVSGSASEMTLLPIQPIFGPAGRKISKGVGNNVDGVKWQRQKKTEEEGTKLPNIWF